MDTSESRKERRRSRSRSRSRDAHKRSSSHSPSHKHRDRERGRDRERSVSGESRSRSKKERRDREKESDKHHKKKKRHRSRSRSDSKSPSRKRSKKEKKKEKKKGSSHELEKQLKAAKKLIQSGGDVTQLANVLDSEALAKLIEVEQKGGSSSSSKRKSKSSKRRPPSSDESTSSESGSDSDTSPSSPRFLSDGVTPRLTRSDYFAKSTEFRVWLGRFHGKHVDDIPTERSHKYFKRFVDEWNKGKLPKEFYKGMESTSVDASLFTKHKWKFATKMSAAEKFQLDSLRDDIDTSTKHSYQQEFQGNHSAAPAASATAASASASTRQAGNASMTTPSMLPDVKRRMDKIEQKRLAAHHAMVMEELVPKETGREARIEKRQQKGAYAHREKEMDESMSERDLMGSGGQSEYQAMLARRQAQTARKEEAAAAKREEYAAKEREKMRNLLASIGQADKYNI